MTPRYEELYSEPALAAHVHCIGRFEGDKDGDWHRERLKRAEARAACGPGRGERLAPFLFMPSAGSPPVRIHHARGDASDHSRRATTTTNSPGMR